MNMIIDLLHPFSGSFKNFLQFGLNLNVYENIDPNI